MKKHSPLPWKLRELKDRGLLFIESPKERVKKPYGQEILADDYFDEFSKKEDCELILKSVNNHYKVIELLEKILERENESFLLKTEVKYLLLRLK
jgi:hypothetical protein